jgi:hypothetical protein
MYSQLDPTGMQAAPRKRRRLSGDKKDQVLQEVKLNPRKKAEILRREVHAPHALLPEEREDIIAMAKNKRFVDNSHRVLTAKTLMAH